MARSTLELSLNDATGRIKAQYHINDPEMKD